MIATTIGHAPMAVGSGHGRSLLSAMVAIGWPLLNISLAPHVHVRQNVILAPTCAANGMPTVVPGP